jgi:hypothetical protein
MIPLPKGIVGTSVVPRRQEHLINMFFANGYIRRTPGRELVATVASEKCRGSTRWYVDDNAYFVVGEVLYQLDSDEQISVIGDVPGFSRVYFSLGQVNLVIVVDGGAGYIYNTSSGLTEIKDPDYLPSRSVDYIDGRHVFIPSDGSPAFYSEIDNPGDIGALNFFDAEELPDKNRVIINLKNNLHIGGQESFEIYRTTGDDNAPYVRRDGGRVDTGYVSGMQRYRSSFMFIGRDRDESYGIHLMSSGSTEIISNEAINEILNNASSDELENADVFSFNWSQHQFVGWNVGRKTIVFVDGNWVFMDSNLDATTNGPWDGTAVVFAHGRYYCGDRLTGNIGKLSDDPGEFGSNMEYSIKTFARTKRLQYFSVPELTLDSLTGQAGSTIGLSLSRDGYHYSDFHYKNLGVTGDYNRVIKWSGGLGVYENFMGIEIRGTGSVKISIEGLQ